MADTQPAKKPMRSGLPPRRWFGFLFFAALAIGAGWLWHRSWQLADLGMYHLRDGSVHGILSHQGNLMLTTTTLSLGPDKAFTADFTTGPSGKDGAWLYEGAYVNATWRKSIWHFGLSAGRKGDVPEAPDLAWSTVVLPHGAVVVVSAILAIWCFWGGVMRPKLRRRLKRGECIHCGYDLRGTEGDTCPECGGAKPARGPQTVGQMLGQSAKEVRDTVAASGSAILTLLLIPAVLMTIRLYNRPPTEAEQAAIEAKAAKLDMPVPVEGLYEGTVREVLVRAATRCGVRVRFEGNATTEIDGEVTTELISNEERTQGRSLADVIDQLLSVSLLRWTVRNGDIVVHLADPPATARVYDAARLTPRNVKTELAPRIRDGPDCTGPWADVMYTVYADWRAWWPGIWRTNQSNANTFVHYGTTAQFGNRVLFIHAEKEQLAFSNILYAVKQLQTARNRP